jgi:peptide/nickel transport system permease protein
MTITTGSTLETGRSSGRRAHKAQVHAVAAGLWHWVISPAATVVVASFVIYLALSAAPGDPVARMLGDRSTDEQRAELRSRLGLDEKVLVRYWHWLTDAFHGDLGTSLISRQEVTSLLGSRLETTAILVLMASVLIFVVGVSLGTIGGISSRWRPLVNFATGLGIAIPSFVAASFLIGIFAVRLGWFPTFGAGQGLVDKVWHLTLPAVALAIGWSAYVAQLTAAAVAEEASTEHVLTARGRGIPARTVTRRHILRNATIPVLTASGLTVAGLIAGSVIVETAFGIDGLGSLLVESILSKDYAPVTAIAVLIVIAFVTITTLIDFAQTWLDPRLRDRR